MPACYHCYRNQSKNHSQINNKKVISYQINKHINNQKKNSLLRKNKKKEYKNKKKV